MIASQVTLERRPDGQAVVVKRSLGPAATERLEHEAIWLRRFQESGVVQLLSHEAGPPATLVTAYAGDRTLAHRPRPGPDQVVELVGSICDTVADLHAQGVVHGRLTPDHVILGAGGRAVICGLAEAGPEDHERTRAEDVAAIGVLLHTLVDGDVEAEPIPDRRPVPWRPSRWSGYLRRALLTLADQATADVPERRPTASHLGAAIRATTPAAGRTRRRPAPRQIAVGIAIVAVLPLVAVVTAAGRRPSEPVAAAPPISSRPTVASTTSISVTTTTVSPVTTTVVAAPPVVALGPGRIQVSGVTYRVGEAGDRLANGDWDCDGTPTLVLLRPATGDLYGFDDWDPTGTGTTGVLLGRRRDAVDLVDTPAPSCAGVPVRLGDGRVVEVAGP